MLSGYDDKNIDTHFFIMKNYLLRFASGLFISILSAVGHGETLSTPNEVVASNKMMNFIKASQIQMLLELGITQERSEAKYAANYPQYKGGKNECNSTHQVKLVRIDVLSQIVFEDNKTYPTQGIWRLGYELAGCSRVTRYSAIATANTNSAPTLSPTYSGDSIARPALIDAALPIAISAISKIKNLPKDCKDIGLASTKLATPPQDFVSDGQSYKNVWQEVWGINYCGQTNKVTMTFIPNKSNGTTSISTRLMASSELIDAAIPSAASAFAVLINKSGQSNTSNECKDLTITNANLMPLLNDQINGLSAKSWTEIWDVAACQRTGKVAATFTEAENGDMHIAVKTKIVKPLILPKSCTRPEYPTASKMLGEEGTARIQFAVSPKGETLKISVIQSSGYERLDDAVITALMSCSFLPAIDEQGVAVAASSELNYRFELH